MGKIIDMQVDGQACKFELSSGKLMKPDGTLLRRLESRDEDRGETLEALSSYAKRHGESQYSRNLRMGGSDDRIIRLDLQPGDVHIPSAMPDFAGGYKLADGVADVVLPVIPVTKPIDKYNVWDAKDAFQLPDQSENTPGGAIIEITPRLSNSSYTSVERAFGSFVTTQVTEAADTPLKPLQAAVRRCMRAATLSREYRAQNLLRTVANWTIGGVAGYVSQLTSDKKWNGGSNSDPVADIHAMQEASFMDITRLIFSEQGMHSFVRNLTVRGYHFAKPDVGSIPSMDQLSSALGIPPITVAKMKYMSTSLSALTYMWGGDLVGIHEPEVNPPTDQEDIATAYTMRWNGGSTPDGTYRGGYLVRTYFDPKRGGRGGTMTVVVHQDAEIITSQLVGGLVTGIVQ